MRYIDTILNLAIVATVGTILGLFFGHLFCCLGKEEKVPMFPTPVEVERAFKP